MQKVCLYGMLLAVLAGGATEAVGQTGILPVAVGVRGGAAFPVGDLGEGDAVSTGWGFEVNAQLRVAPMFAVYAAYDRFEFPVEEGILFGLGEVEGDLTDSGFAVGGMLSLPTGFIGVAPWVRAGAIYNTAQYQFGSAEWESDPNLGYEVGGGLTFPLGLVVSFTPAVRYRSYSPEFNGNDDSGSDSDLSTIVADLGLTIRF